jgi:nucleotide-binding universal stress UspA family protein
MNRAAVMEHYGPPVAQLDFERGTDGPRVILVTLDGSRSAEHAVAYACGIARRQQCHLVVLFVAAHLTFASAMSPMVAAAVMRSASELAELLRREVRRMAEELGVPTTLVMRDGDRYTALVETADLVKADVVAVGSSADRRWGSSLTRRLIRQGRWPVVVVP